MVDDIDHREVMERVGEDAGWSNHFVFMTLMSAGIAVLGLLLSSPAVVIGAMLISPLMGPIIGFGFALATFDAAELKRSGWALAVGVLLAVLFCALIVTVSPLQTVTDEILSRTRPNLFDLLVALFSGMAGTYAMIRGRHGAIVGVAIATALMPPLAVMGFGLATTNWQVFSGSTLLFFTNLMTIAAAAAVLARLYGFATGLSPHQTRLQASLIIVSMAALGVPLALTLRQIAWEALASREASATIAAAFPASARVNDLSINFHARPLEVSATVLTPEYRPIERQLRERLSRVMQRPLLLSLDQVRTSDGAQDPSTANASAVQRQATRVAEQLSLISGAQVQDIIVDRSSHYARVRAAVLPGAELGAYRLLEQRVAERMQGWTISLVPPLLPPPSINFSEDQPDAEALQTAIWASRRLGLPVSVSGGRSEEVQQVAKSLADAGVEVSDTAAKGPAGKVVLEWQIPSNEEEPNRPR